MSEQYYLESDQYPKIVKLVTTRVLVYISALLYQTEFQKNPETAAKRLIISDMGAGEQFNIRSAIEGFEKFSDLFPYTVYSIGDMDRGEIKNHTAQGGYVFIPELNRKVATWQMKLTIPMISFFNRADDYHRAMTLLYENSSTLVRIYVPLVLNKIAAANHPNLQNISVTAAAPIDLEYKISKGNFAYAFQTYLTENKIWNIQHDVDVTFYDMTLSENFQDLTVTQMIANLHSSNNPAPFLSLLPGGTPLSVVSTVPANLESNININISAIQITFATKLKQNKSEFLITFDPPINYEFDWDTTGKILTFTIINPLSNGLVYTVTIPKEIEDENGQNLEDDYIFQFQTVAV